MKQFANITVMAGLALAAACHSAPPPEPEPVPVATTTPTPTVAARNVFNQDSADAADRARSDSAARARAWADSVERARLALAAATAVRTELAVLVHFDVGQARLQPDGRDALDRKVTILNANPMVRLRITGACDDRGSEAYNQGLGQRRAGVVRRYLISKGIDATRLDVMSAGEGSPVDTGDSEAAWAMNRRAEFAIVSGDNMLGMSR
ncbi:MAG: OmpA family protein [Gemmatimonadota bacterium]